MPITPLHFGLLAITNQWWTQRVSVVSFVLVNLWIDAPAILAWFVHLPLPSHDALGHTFLGAVLFAALFAAPGYRSRAWVLGAFLGAITHVLLDALVHSDMRPFAPLAEGNFFYLSLMEPLSLVLLPLTIWFVAQVVTSSLHWIRRRRLVAQTERIEPAGPKDP